MTKLEQLRQDLTAAKAEQARMRENQSVYRALAAESLSHWDVTANLRSSAECGMRADLIGTNIFDLEQALKGEGQ